LQKRKVLSLECKTEGVMDDESSTSMEQVEEVPLKEFGENQASRGILDDADYILRISAGELLMLLLVNKVLNTKTAHIMHFSADNALNIVCRLSSARTRWRSVGL